MNNGFGITKHAFISPIPYLQYVPSDSRVHLMLVHLMDDERYNQFYRDKQRRGDFIIIDNSAFEFGEPASLATIRDKCIKAQIVPDIVVAPDYPGQPWSKTYEAAITADNEFIDYFDPEKTQLMCVPQSERNDYVGWLECYDLMIGNIGNCGMIGMSILGIPTAFKEWAGTEDVSTIRSAVTAYLIQEELASKNHKHHYLGCHSPRELLMMKYQGLAWSNDSSTAIWHGIHNVEFDASPSGLKNGKIPVPVDFELPCVLGNEPIHNNIEWIRSLLQDK